MSVPPESPEEVTQRIPPLRPSDTTPLWRPSEIGQLDSLLSTPPPAPAPPPAPRPSRRGLLVKAAGLLGVAVVSGLVWLVVMPKDTPTGTPTTTPPPAGEFTFAKSAQAPEPLKDSDCASHAYGQTKAFLTATPCQQLTRGLYTTRTPDGATVYTSVSVVRMRTVEDATKLKDLTSRDGTGNVNDLVKDGAVKVQGLSTLGNGGFAAQLKDRDLVIIESDTITHGANEAEHNRLMKKISFEAMRLADELRE
ncbi:hypothetical protein [Saccharothrix longispora]|uniref:hypothetical protein n=1 Tax=Saccharothrix longispora TaxID=33920 RepID=UPI0028FDA221|nr:hypothetical protein [Saccharothrix longispora]MBY8847952.1 hypothetical protein [Saccharothrix sp. MB29]MDU0293368.1 hypothetical protein [Saccharothrix longispora]